MYVIDGEAPAIAVLVRRFRDQGFDTFVYT